MDCFKYHFDEETEILYKYYYGPITVKEIYSSWDYAIEYNLIPQETRGIILDYTKAHFNFPIKEHGRIAEYYRDHIDVFRNQRIAILTQSDRDVIVPTLVELKDDGYSSRPFFTLNAAISWVLGSK